MIWAYLVVFLALTVGQIYWNRRFNQECARVLGRISEIPESPAPGLRRELQEPKAVPNVRTQSQGRGLPS